MDLDLLKKKRAVLRTAVTKIINTVESLIKDEVTNADTLEEHLNQLNIKTEKLKEVDNNIEPLLKTTEYETELISTYEYSDKISSATFRAQKKLKGNINCSNNHSNTSPDISLSSTNDNKHVKLPKLNIQKFYGDCTQFYSFYNTFKVSIHDNDSLTKIEKFNYLKSYLSGPAAYAIAGFEISDENYDSALKILEDRFGQKDIIINNHMNKLLNLSPVYKSSDVLKLKRLHDDIEVNVRSLSALGLKSESYSAMLVTVILKIIPYDLALEYNRQSTKNPCNPDINQLLNFLQTEILTRERTNFSKPKVETKTEINKNKNSFSSKPEMSTTHGFLAAVRNDSSLSDRNEKKTEFCLFCKKEHNFLKCDLDVDKKKNILKSQGRCYKCLGLRHRVRECLSKKNCAICSGKHHESICFRSNSFNTEKSKVICNEGEIKDEIISAVSHTATKSRILLQTCYSIVRNNNRELGTRLLLDTGAMKSFLNQEIADKLNCKVIRKEKLSVYTFGNKNPIEKQYDVVKITLINRNFPDSKLEIEALVTDEISGSNIPPPEIKGFNEMKQLKNITLADSPECQEPITILIGADYYYNIVTGNIKHLNKDIVAVETILGWCLQGRKGENQASLMLSVVVDESLISKQIQKFWDLETSGLVDPKRDADPTENDIMRQFESQIQYENKRYTVRLPWKWNKRCLNDNRRIAEERFSKLRKRFYKNPELYLEYKKVLDDYLEQKIIEPITNPEGDGLVTFYLPHREIIRKDRETSKLRIVFDASSYDSGSLSLNDCLHVGPNLYSEIFDILLRFRFHPIAYTTDMKQAFLQICINEDDRDVSRFLFTEDPSDESIPPQIYRFTRVLFGINSSPFLLAATIKHHLKKYTEKYPETTDFLNENIYVDDIIGSHCSVDQALSCTLESREIFEEASLSLHKWRTNSKTLSELWKENGVICNNSSEPLGEENASYKVLGIAWDNLKDTLYFDVENLINFVSKGTDTKRFVLQVLGRIFDPVGFLGPFTVRIKCLMQKIWQLGIEWDDNLPEDQGLLWKSWCDEVSQLTKFSVARHYFSEIPDNEINTLELHIFSDASMKAFGTVAYLRVTFSNEDIRTVFVASKNRIAPIKSLTLPRLELMAALLSARLSFSILKALKHEIPCYFWSDSKITLFWIKGTPEKFKPFVKNRVEEIQKLTSTTDWYHCPGNVNPADIVSRGAKVSKLFEDPIWLLGPKWLSAPPEYWPMSESKEEIDAEELEYRKKSNTIFQYECLIQEQENPIDIAKFSHLEKLVRVTAWVKKIVMKFRKKKDKCYPLTTEELVEAENDLIRFEQRRFFKAEHESLKNGDPIEKDSILFNFAPFMDEDKILRLGGRLELGDLSTEEKHPIILPKQSWLATLIVRREHEKAMHGGTAYTLARVRHRFWIPKGRQMVKGVIKKCLICQKYLCKPANQITAPLPEDRINSTPPFSVCGLDFAGPIYVKSFKETQKSYIVLFTCGVTRSIHLELVSNMTTDYFLLALRRFLARRGNCKVIYSDNAKTFKRAKKEIEDLAKIISNDSLSKFLTKERIVWKNIVERAAWWGGFYERLVKSVKDCLRKIIGKALLNFEEMTTLLVEVEAVLNMRPLTYVYNENDEPLPLTPMNFLNFGREPTYPINCAEIIENGSKRSSLLKRRKYQSLLLKQLWAKWKQQYLLDLRTAHTLKNPNWQDELKVGDVVLIEEDTKNKLLWKLGKIEKTILGRDNNVRSYEVKTSTGLLRRTIQHLYPLEL